MNSILKGFGDNHHITKNRQIDYFQEVQFQVGSSTWHKVGIQ